MNVELPDTGCNIINSSTSFYNFSPDNRTRETWIIYDGKAILQSSTTSQYGYTYSGTCLNTGDLVYRPELKGVWFPIVGLIVILFIYRFVFRLFRGRL